MYLIISVSGVSAVPLTQDCGFCDIPLALGRLWMVACAFSASPICTAVPFQYCLLAVAQIVTQWITDQFSSIQYESIESEPLKQPACVNAYVRV